MSILALAIGNLQPAKAQDSAADLTSGKTYARLLRAAKANPAGTDWVALRKAYAASPAYDPMTSSAPDLSVALRANDRQRVADIAVARTERHWVDLQAHLYAAAAERQLGNIEAANLHHAVAAGLFHAIMASGNGASPQSAFVVLSTSEEYALLTVMRVRSTGQSLIRDGGHAYDRLSIVGPDGRSLMMYFNVDTSLARETAIVTGRAKPVADADLPL